MKRVYLIRSGAFGDHLHMSPCLRAFKQEGWHVTFEYNQKGAQIHAFNPYVDQHIGVEPSTKLYIGEENASYEHYVRLSKIKKDYDHFVDFTNSLEKALIAGEGQPDYFLPKEDRNRKFGKTCFHDQSILWAGLPEKYLGRKSEVYFRKKEHDRVKELLEPYKKSGMYILIWSLAGSMWQKAIYPWSKNVCDEFQKRHPDVFIVLTAGPIYKDNVWEGKNVMSVVGNWPFRQVLLATRYANGLVTPETGLGIGAGAYDTPKIMLMTAASVKNIVGNDKNDFSIQSNAWCSPCHRAIYDMDLCDTFPIDKEYEVAYGKNKKAKKLPICVSFDEETVLNRMEEMYYCRHEPDWSHRDEEVYV